MDEKKSTPDNLVDLQTLNQETEQEAEPSKLKTFQKTRANLGILKIEQISDLVQSRKGLRPGRSLFRKKYYKANQK